MKFSTCEAFVVPGGVNLGINVAVNLCVKLPNGAASTFGNQIRGSNWPPSRLSPS